MSSSKVSPPTFSRCFGSTAETGWEGGQVVSHDCHFRLLFPSRAWWHLLLLNMIDMTALGREKSKVEAVQIHSLKMCVFYTIILGHGVRNACLFVMLIFEHVCQFACPSGSSLCQCLVSSSPFRLVCFFIFQAFRIMVLLSGLR